MKNRGKKALCLVAALAMFGATLAGCGDGSYKGDNLSDYVAGASVQSNGGFAVKQGDFVYFINGSESYTAGNSYGDVVKGALMRVSASDLAKGDYSNVKTVVPSLFATPSVKAGVYIFGDYVYYATPTTDKNLDGEVENNSLDFKYAKLDGSEAPSKYFFRVSTSSSDTKYLTNYRFVSEAGVDRNNDGKDDVFCLYEMSEDGTKYLKSLNVATGEDVVLVKGAKSSFFYDMKNLDNPNVYYTMAVNYNVDSAESTTAQYDQLYTVNASARATTNASEASYTVENGRTYAFDKEYLKEIEADLGNYATYPYANLGTLVLDGVGQNSQDSRFNVEDKAASTEISGYTYTVSRYENGGVYFTRKSLNEVGGASDTNLYYLADSKVDMNKSVSNNDFKKADKVVDIVSNETTNASATALFELNNGKHSYLYVSGNKIVKATPDEKGVATTLNIARNLSGVTLLQTNGDYVYYYATGTNGRSLSRINYKGDEQTALSDPYNSIFAENEKYKEYQPITLALVDWSDSWYNPEFLPETNVVLYPNAQSFGNGGSAYNYVYAARIDSTAKIEELNKANEKVDEYLAEYSDSAASQNLIKFFFRTDLANKISAESKAEYDKEFFAQVEGKFGTGEDKLVKESAIIGLVGKLTAADAEAMEEAWLNSLLQPEDTQEEESGMPGYVVWIIVVASVIVVAAIVAVPVALNSKKKAAKRREEEATVNAYKRKKIDTTDDKSIDVYADEEKAEEAVEEVSEEPSEEVADEATEAEETVENDAENEE